MFKLSRIVIKKFLNEILIKLLNLSEVKIRTSFISCAFKETLSSSLKNSLRGDYSIPQYLIKMEGMSGRKFRNLLNNIPKYFDKDIKYLEIGTWTGSTLCSILFKNKNIKKVAIIDNFSQFGGTRKVLEKNLELIKDNIFCDIQIYSQDFRSFDFNSCKTKFNIYFFDGPHEYVDHYDSIRLVYDYLDNEFLFIVDDWNWQIVIDATNKILKELNIKILSKIEIFTAKNNKSPRIINRQYSDWHNGYVLLSCKK